jgi:hypothetical protein
MQVAEDWSATRTDGPARHDRSRHDNSVFDRRAKATSWRAEARQGSRDRRGYHSASHCALAEMAGAVVYRRLIWINDFTGTPA